MNTKFLWTIFGSVILASCDGSTSNPATVSRDKLTPPSNLVSITGDSSVQLVWQANNAEEEFQGFQVFGASTNLEALYKLVKYPVALTSAAQLLTTAVPHCEDNSAFYEAFGFDKSEKGCKGGDAEKKAAGSTLLTVAKDDDELPPKSKLKCHDDGDKYSNDTISVKLSGIAMNQQRCTVKTAWDGSKLADIVNGTEYVFIVVSVMGEEFDEKSWSSNSVMDVPSKTALTGTYTLKRSDNSAGNSDAAADSQYIRFAFDASNVVTAGTPTTCTGNICKLSGQNSQTDQGIYVGRDEGSLNPQRLFISTPKDGRIELQPVGRATIGGDIGRLPGDEATTSYPSSKGAKFEVLGDQIFDLKITNADASVNYGKAFVKEVTYEGTKTNTKIDAKFDITIVIQPKKGSTYYLH